MNESSTPPIVLFLHLVNSGGLPLYSWMKAQYSWKALLPFQTFLGDPRFLLGAPTAWVVRPRFPSNDGVGSPEEQLEPVDRSALRLVLGHFRYGLHRCFRRPARYVTLVRDPVRRVLSYYFFLRRKHPEVLATGPSGALISVEDWVESPKFASIVRNDQARSIAGRGGTTWGSSESGEDYDDPRIYDEARRNIDFAFSLVGIAEKYDESLMLLSERMGWGPLWYGWVRRRPALGPPTVSERTRARVAELNALDLALYRHVRSEFDEQVRQCGAGWMRRVERFRKINAWGERIPFHLR